MSSSSITKSQLFAAFDSRLARSSGSKLLRASYLTSVFSRFSFILRACGIFRSMRTGFTSICPK